MRYQFRRCGSDDVGCFDWSISLLRSPEEQLHSNVAASPYSTVSVTTTRPWTIRNNEDSCSVRSHCALQCVHSCRHVYPPSDNFPCLLQQWIRHFPKGRLAGGTSASWMGTTSPQTVGAPCISLTILIWRTSCGGACVSEVTSLNIGAVVYRRYVEEQNVIPDLETHTVASISYMYCERVKPSAAITPSFPLKCIYCRGHLYVVMSDGVVPQLLKKIDIGSLTHGVESAVTNSIFAPIVWLAKG